MEKFCTRLRQLMFYKGIRQHELSEMSGVEKSKISRYVNGKYRPNAQTLQKLADALGVSPAYLICGSDEMQENHTYNQNELQSNTMVAEGHLPYGDSPIKGVPVMAEIITSEELDMIIRYRKADERAKALIKMALDVADKYPATTPGKTEKEA